MKKVFSVIALSALAGTLMLTSCKKDDDDGGSSLAKGWNQESVDAAINACAQGNTEMMEECTCYFEKVSENISAEEFATEAGIEEAQAYAEECGYGTAE